VGRRPLEELIGGRLSVLGGFCIRDFVSAAQRGTAVIDDEDVPSPPYMFFKGRGYRHLNTLSSSGAQVAVDLFDTFLTITSELDESQGGIYVLALPLPATPSPLQALSAESAITDILRIANGPQGEALVLGDAAAVIRSFPAVT
jgi:hypothetical protein